MYNGICILYAISAIFVLCVAALSNEPSANLYLLIAILSSLSFMSIAKGVFPQVAKVFASQDHRDTFDKVLILLSFALLIIGAGIFSVLTFLGLILSENEYVGYLIYGAGISCLLAILIPAYRHASYNPSED